jgi:hypothetical protein
VLWLAATRGMQQQLALTHTVVLPSAAETCCRRAL